MIFVVLCHLVYEKNSNTSSRTFVFSSLAQGQRYEALDENRTLIDIKTNETTNNTFALSKFIFIWVYDNNSIEQ